MPTDHGVGKSQSRRYAWTEQGRPPNGCLRKLLAEDGLREALDLSRSRPPCRPSLLFAGVEDRDRLDLDELIGISQK